MEIKVEEIRQGDEIIILGAAPKYVKVLEDAVLDPVKTTSYKRNVCKTLKCHINEERKQVMVNRWVHDPVQNKYVSRPTPTFKRTYGLDTPTSEHPKKRINLNHHRLWLVNRTAV